MRRGMGIGWAVWACWAVPVLAGEPAVVFSFGKALLNERLPHEFHWPNSGGDVLEVRSATPSCDCVQIVEWTPYVEAGATGSVQVIFTPDRAGDVDYRILLQTSDPQTPEIEFAVRGTVTAPPRVRRNRDWPLYVSAEVAEKLVQDPGRVTWVDVRSEEAFEDSRIPGSIRIPRYAVKTKGFLRGRPVVLVTDGSSWGQLEAEVRTLRDRGFASVSIWYGGLHAWREMGGRLEGTGQASIRTLPPDALHTIPAWSDWLAAGVGIDASRLPEEAVALDFSSERKSEFADRIHALLADRPDVLFLLLVTPDGGMDPALAAVLDDLDVFVYELEGGWEAWERHRQMTEAIQQGQSAGQTAVSRSSATGSAIRRRGCGGCP